MYTLCTIIAPLQTLGAISSYRLEGTDQRDPIQRGQASAARCPALPRCIKGDWPLSFGLNGCCSRVTRLSGTAPSHGLAGRNGIGIGGRDQHQARTRAAAACGAGCGADGVQAGADGLHQWKSLFCTPSHTHEPATVLHQRRPSENWPDLRFMLI